MKFAKTQLVLILEKEWFRGLVVALIMIGGALILYGVYQFVDASSRISNNVVYQREAAGTEVQSPTDARMFMAAEVEYRSLRIQRSNSFSYGGVGLALMAAGWLGYDFARAHRRKRQLVMPSQSSVG
jgi:hypothetical protein